MARDRIKVYDVLLRGDMENPTDEIYETKKGIPRYIQNE